MRIEEDLLYQMQAKFWKQQAIRAKIALVQQELQALVRDDQTEQEKLTGLLNVANNRHEVSLGQTHVWDVETGEITPINNGLPTTIEMSPPSKETVQ